MITKGIVLSFVFQWGEGGKWGWVIKVGFVKFMHVPHNFWQAGDLHFLLLVSRMNEIGWLSPSLLEGTKSFHAKWSTAFSVLCACVSTAEHSTQAADCSYLETHVRLLGAILNPLNAELNPICYLLALLGTHHFLHVSRIRVKSLTFRLLMSYIYIWSAYSWCF